MIPLCDFENRLLPNELIVIRNNGDDDEIAGEVIGDVMGQQGRPSQGGGPIKTDFESVCVLGILFSLMWTRVPDLPIGSDNLD